MAKSKQHTSELGMSKIWLVLAIILVGFLVIMFLDRMLATAIPTYTGLFTTF